MSGVPTGLKTCVDRSDVTLQNDATQNTLCPSDPIAPQRGVQSGSHQQAELKLNTSALAEAVQNAAETYRCKGFCLENGE